ncbi:UNKNOWN [Stylonychia lemnae]|uniref:Uncharacterized protein n=1 Tax=Stylonychia lemnae TaxID=5949 RepID=A0A078AE92_STYLE|nr:UNKNOWN [Stylonychia lemnae]|eukprot:CDW79822.1 UNKNOWN [Stylonychia lemnae]
MKKSYSQRDISSNYISIGFNSPCKDKNKSIPPIEVQNGDLLSRNATNYYQEKSSRLLKEAIQINKSVQSITPKHQLHLKDYNSSFEKLRIELTHSHIQSKRDRLDQEEDKLKKEKDHKELLICKSQRMVRDGFTNFDIINFSKKESLMPLKQEKLGKKFDYNGGQYHNYQASYLKKIEDNKKTFFRNSGLCAQRINNCQNHYFICNPLKKV